LRCCHKTSNGWLGHVGGGVMLDSEPELEWQETEWKRQAFIFANDAHFQ
ncbi:MAG: chorismate binding enzyme, partial [Bacteroidota bacterium]